MGNVGLRVRGVLIELMADQFANLEQPFDLRLHQGRFNPFHLRWIPLKRYGGGTFVRGTPVSGREDAVKFGGRSGSRRYKSWR